MGKGECGRGAYPVLFRKGRGDLLRHVAIPQLECRGRPTDIDRQGEQDRPLGGGRSSGGRLVRGQILGFLQDRLRNRVGGCSHAGVARIG